MFLRIVSFGSSHSCPGFVRPRGKNIVGRFVGLACLLMAFAIMQLPAFGQSQFATLSGTVTDSSGAAIAGAKITVKGTTSGELRESETNADGFFTLATLPAGSYDISAEKVGFKRWEGKNIVLNGSDIRSMKIDLRVGVVTETVVVEGSTT